MHKPPVRSNSRHRFKILAMKRGALTEIGTFATKDEAEAYITIALRSNRYGSISISDSKKNYIATAADKVIGKSSAGPITGTAAISSNSSRHSVGMPYGVLVLITLALIAGAILLIEGVNKLLDTTL